MRATYLGSHAIALTLKYSPACGARGYTASILTAMLEVV